MGCRGFYEFVFRLINQYLNRLRDGTKFLSINTIDIMDWRVLR